MQPRPWIGENVISEGGVTFAVIFTPQFSTMIMCPLFPLKSVIGSKAELRKLNEG